MRPTEDNGMRRVCGPPDAQPYLWLRPLSLGYVDFPPVTALLGAGGRVLFGESRIGLRMLSLVAGAGVVVVCTRFHVVARVRIPYGVDNDEEGAPIASCTLRGGLDAVWPELLDPRY